MKVQSTNYLRNYSFCLCAISLCIFSLTAIATPSLQDDDTRKMIDTSFLQKRPPSPRKTRKTPNYKRVTPKISEQIAKTEKKTETKPGDKTENKPGDKVENKPGDKSENQPEIKSGNEIVGLTLWQLRPSVKSDDKSVRILEREDENSVEWTPVRVDSDTVFALGDRVRLSFESPRDGYLYVIDRELYEDGSFSEPVLIFPTLKDYNGNNKVTAGRVIEIPKTSFRLKTKRPDYKGERLSFIVTPEPLKEVTIGRGTIQLESAQVNTWEKNWSVVAEKWELEKGKGQIYTKAEKEAGENHARLLTQDDELPQTLFVIATKPGNPFLLNFPMRITK
jgi:hypothetical protein